MQVFDVARDIPASTIAGRAGLTLQQKGLRYWACCPFHNEKTASLCFFPDGGWKCFGCGRGGDATAFAQELYHIPALDAAHMIVKDYRLRVSPRSMDVFRWRNDRIQRLQRIRKDADALLRAPTWTAEHAEQAFDDPMFTAAIRAREACDQQIDTLRAADEHTLEIMRREGSP